MWLEHSELVGVGGLRSERKRSCGHVSIGVIARPLAFTLGWEVIGDLFSVSVIISHIP
jgi:hypothetical protein